MRVRHTSLKQTEQVHDQYTYKEKQRDGAKQHMADVVFTIGIAVGQCVIGDEARDQEKYPIDQQLAELAG